MLLEIPKIIPNDWKRLDTIINKIRMRLGSSGSPTFAGLTLTGLTVSSLVGTNASDTLESVTIGTGLSYVRPTLSLSHLGIESLIDAGADKVLFWDDSETASKWLAISTGLQITTTNLTTKDSEIVHDSLSGFVANEHIDHSTVSVIAGTGMSGGGTIAADRTLNCSITQYTDELAQDAVGGMIADTNTINLTYTDTTPELKADLVYQDTASVDLADDASGLKATVLPAGVDHNALLNVHQDVNTTASPTFVDLSLSGDLIHSGDVDTKISFYDDGIILQTGNLNLLDIKETESEKWVWINKEGSAGNVNFAVGYGSTILDFDGTTGKLALGCAATDVTEHFTLWGGHGMFCSSVSDNVRLYLKTITSGAYYPSLFFLNSAGTGYGLVMGDPVNSQVNIIIGASETGTKILTASSTGVTIGTDLLFTANNIILQATDAEDKLILAGSFDNADPIAVELQRYSATPAANDYLGFFTFYGKDSINETTAYVQIRTQIVDPTNTIESGRLSFGVMGNGTFTERFYIHGTSTVIVGNLDISNGILSRSGVQVVGARVIDARIDDTINSGDATTDGVIDAIRDAMVTHGLIAAA